MVLGIFGAGGFGREVLECVKQIHTQGERWQKVLFIDDYTSEKVVNQVSVVRYQEFKEQYSVTEAEIFIGVGEPKSRESLWNLLKEDGYTVATVVNPNVWIPDTTVIGEGCYIAYGAFISCNITIGENTLVMPYASIGHDSVIGSHCVCSDQSNIAGDCNIGNYSFLGLNSIVREKVSIAEWTVVSAGSAVLKDITEKEYIVAGVPARKVQLNTEHKVF